jgi:Core-2/I-Branching enzyme
MHAYAILAHKNLDQLHRLVRTLDTGQASFFLHIDKKTDIRPYRQELNDLSRMPNVEFVKRYHSPWASFGIVQAQRAAMEGALRAKSQFTHITLLTGLDYPIKAPHEIDAFFAVHRGTSYMRFFGRRKKKGRRRLLEPPHQAWRYKNWYFYFAGRRRRISSRLLKKVGINRRIPGGLRPVKGWAFFTLSKECAEYASEFVKQNPGYVRFFKHTMFADEYFWHTILVNSPLRKTVVNTTLRYEPFDESAIPITGHGRVLGREDIDQLKVESSQRFFAKKFDNMVDADILDLIDRNLLKATNPSAL